MSLRMFCCIWLLSLCAAVHCGPAGRLWPGAAAVPGPARPALTDVPRLIALSLPAPAVVGGQSESLLHTVLVPHWLRLGDAWQAGGRDRQRVFNPESVKNGTEVPPKCCGVQPGTGAREWIWRSTGDHGSNPFQEETDDSHKSGPSYSSRQSFRPRCMV
ncbi:hypothetical protein MHYP_G00294040 [Metynnis hypsauchen]